jgi:hypothetical protein
MMLLAGMTHLLTATIFLKPIVYDSGRLWMLLPLTLAISVVYKATRIDNLRAVPMAAFLLWATIVGGMLAVAVALYIIIALFV